MQLYDELLANADRLLTAALTLLNAGNIGLAGSLAILGLEESGKAIAIHNRRVEIAQEPEGSDFVNEKLSSLWRAHSAKLKLVHEFLVNERYWFSTEPPDPVENQAWLGEIAEWSKRHNILKQNGFYVDVDSQQGIVTPTDITDEITLGQIIKHVHQIGWQLRLGEHIVAREQEMFNDLLSMSKDSEAICPPLHNDEYRFKLRTPGTNPFADLGKPGYEAQARELGLLAEDIGLTDPDEDD